mgnify:CR=1 FL=1
MTITKMVRKIAIFYTDHDDEWTDPYGNFVDMATKLLNETKNHPMEVEYEMFHIYNNEFPTLLQLNETNDSGELVYMGIFITGSRYDSFDENTEWIVKFRGLLNEILKNDTNYPPIVGICFGHQVIAKTLGSNVGRNPKGFEGGVVPIELNPVGEKLFGTNKLHLSEVHNDIVFDLPPGNEYINWGSSTKCAIQGMYKKNKLLTFQGHPEFVNEIAANGVEKTRKKLAEKGIDADVQDELNQMVKNTNLYQNDGQLASNKIWQLFLQQL